MSTGGLAGCCISTKQLGRIRGAGHRVTGNRSSQNKRLSGRAGELGWEFVHVCVDDATRLPYAEVLVRTRPSAAAFLERAVA